MKTGRNDPCPCGSGKKYKKCCGSKAESAPGATDAKPGDAHGSSRDGFSEEDGLLFNNTINRLRRFTLDKKEHIKEYYKARKIHGEILNGMIDYFEDGKFEPTIDPDFRVPESGRVLADNKNERTLIFTGINFDTNTHEGQNAFHDTIVYKNAPNMSCITEEFISKHRYRKPEKIEFLHSMLDSRPGLFEITGTDAGEGYVFLKEVFTGAEYRIVDIALSARHIADFAAGHYHYLRIISYKNISFNAGIILTFRKTDRFIIDFIRQNKKDYNPNGGFVRFVELFNQYSSNPDKPKIHVNTI